MSCVSGVPKFCTHFGVRIWSANASQRCDEGCPNVECADSRVRIFLLSTIFFFLFTHNTTYHPKYNKQNNRHILNISRSNQKGRREGMTIKTQKSLLYTITYIQQKTLPASMVEAWPHRLAPLHIPRHYLQEATDPICFSTHVWC